MGVGTADAVARPMRALLEAEMRAIYCESQKRQEKVDVCMLNFVRRSAYTVD